MKVKLGPYCVGSLLKNIQDVEWEEPLRFFQDSCISADDKGTFVSVISAKNSQFFIFDMVIKHNHDPYLLRYLLEFGGPDFLISKYEWQDDEGDVDLDEEDRRRESYQLGEKSGFVSGNTLLHFACTKDTPIDLLNDIIDRGGKDLVMLTNSRGETALHLACCNNSSLEVINKLIEAGGKELLLMENDQGENTLYYTCYYSDIIKIEVVKRLIDVGGKNLIMNIEPTQCCSTLNLLYFQRCNAPHKELIQEFINVGGEDLLTLKDIEGRHALQYWIQRHRDFPWTENKKAAIRLMVAASIKLKIWSEFSIGGLISETSCDADCLLMKREQCMIWEQVIPFLKNLLQSLKQPILHAAILNRAPKIFFDQISENDTFDWSINIRDSVDRLPIDIAIQEKLGWHEGMKQIVEKTAKHEERSVISVAAQYGLGWSNGVEEIVKGGNAKLLVQCKDYSTGLYPFMLAALGENYDLDVIFNLLHPDLFIEELMFSN